MRAMSTTLATFQPPIGWLNLDASRNIDFMSVTDATFHATRLPRKEIARENIEAIVVVPAVFQFEMSLLKAGAS